MRQVQKVGTVLGGHQILTTANDLFDRTLVRLQKGGRGRWWIGCGQTWLAVLASGTPATASVLRTRPAGCPGERLKRCTTCSHRPRFPVVHHLRRRVGHQVRNSGPIASCADPKFTLRRPRSRARRRQAGRLRNRASCSAAGFSSALAGTGVSTFVLIRGSSTGAGRATLIAMILPLATMRRLACSASTLLA